jgi:predicted DNA-binding transcriptional regulator AlpA
MTSSSLTGGTAAPKPIAPAIKLLTAKEAAQVLRCSVSWLAKARMRGDGPPYIQIGRSIRYPEDALIRWMKGRQRLSTSERCHEPRCLPARIGSRRASVTRKSTLPSFE